MSEQKPDKVEPEQKQASRQTAAAAAAAAAAESARLADLMARGEQRTAPPRPNLENEALRAAETALLQGQQALAAARAQLQEPAKPKGSRRREQMLRLLLAGNLLLMIAVMLLPSPSPMAPVQPEPAPVTKAHDPAVQQEPPAQPPASASDPYLQALAAANAGDYKTALALLDAYLAATPRLPSARLMGVYQAQAYYASLLGEDLRAADYERKAAALQQSHTLPEDLLTMAKHAEERGDTAAMRKVYARLLLQQRQIPPSLYKHVAEAYLKLGDSYRTAAESGAEAARKQELEQLRSNLREGR